MTPKELTAWATALVPVLGLLGYGGYTQLDAVSEKYITVQRAQAAHINTQIKILELQLRALEDKEMTPRELIYYEQLMSVRGDLEKERNDTLGITTPK